LWLQTFWIRFFHSDNLLCSLAFLKAHIKK
jgi:hypothetical protein